MPPIAEEEHNRTNLHLCLFSDFALRNLLRPTHKSADGQMIQDLRTKCACSANVNRITHPEIPPWISKFKGEISGADIVYPFSVVRPCLSAKKGIVLTTACVLPRFWA